jgi:hypothetical protein
LIKTSYYDKYLVSEYHCKYLLNILETQNLSLSDFLYDEIAVVYLLEYLEKENVRDLLKFWMQAENFSRNLIINKSSIKKSNLETMYKQWQNDAMVIYDNYISLQAKSCLGFDTLVRCQVESNICQDLDKEENIDYLINTYSNCFYVPMLIVFNMLEKIYFNKFLNSSLYKTYINEIIVNSEIASDNTNNKHDMNNKKNIEINNNKKTSPVINDDALWIRPNETSNMQLGKIDSTGRFIRNFKIQPEESTDMLNRLVDDDDPWNLFNDNNTKTVLKGTPATNSVSLVEKSKSKFEKLINLIPINGLSSKSDEEEREIAERMAAMLVNDVIRQNQLI